MSGGLCDPSDVEGLIDRMVAFIAAGMRAPAGRNQTSELTICRTNQAIPYLFLLPALVAAQATAPLELSLKQAIEMALAPDGNARVRLAQEAVRQAQSRSAQARAALLPNLDASCRRAEPDAQPGRLRHQDRAAHPRLHIPGTGGAVQHLRRPGQRHPDHLRLRRHTPLPGLQDRRPGRGRRERRRRGTRSPRLVALQYLAAVRAEARVDSAEADVNLAESLLQLATNQKEAGTGTGIEVTRARVQLAQARQQLLLAQNDLRQAQLELLRTIGLPLEHAGAPHRQSRSAAGGGDDAREGHRGGALKTRSDWKAQQKREEAARLTYSGVKMERLPSVVGFADYGTIGNGHHNSDPDTDLRPLGARAGIRRRPPRRAARREPQPVRAGARFAPPTCGGRSNWRCGWRWTTCSRPRTRSRSPPKDWRRSRRKWSRRSAATRPASTSSLEVTDAQTRLARARDNHIAALFLYNRARLDLWQAMGTIRQMVD